MSISDELTAALAYHAEPLVPADRQPFIAEVTAELATVAEIGPGTVARAVRGIQAKYLDQAAIGVAKRPWHVSKYSRPLSAGRLKVE